MTSGRWQIWADTGGTFTDCVGLAPDGELHRAKVLSSAAVRGRVLRHREDGAVAIGLPWELPDGFFAGCTFRTESASTGIAGFEAEGSLFYLEGRFGPPAPGQAIEIRCPCEAPVLGAHLLTRTALDAALPPVALRLATTRGTNALLERQGGPTALFVTRGFADLLAIGNQQRPELFALQIVKPAPLYEAVVEVGGRLAADGEIVEPLDLEALDAGLNGLRGAGIESAAVALLHSWANPTHEEALAGRLREAGFRHVSTSAELARRIRYVPRAETALVDAYLSAVVGGYLDGVAAGVGRSSVLTMTSAGGVVRAARFRAKDSLLSGPAGGVVGAASAGAASGQERLLAFDMGGTSTDVSRFDGDFDYRYETVVGAARLLAPCLAIETVAAGGGSICAFDGAQLKVGPASAGADPGPACYGFGGPLTLTDVNLLLGRLDPQRFEIPIDTEAARTAAVGVLSGLTSAEDGAKLEELLEGLLQIADERMADAVRRISVREGFDPSEYCLVAFGGAGGQHACAVAELLGMERALVPADASLLSAYGLGAARVERFAERQVLAPLGEVEREVAGWLDQLEAEAAAEVEAEGIDASRIEVRFRRAAIRLAGQDAALELEVPETGGLQEGFVGAYRERYGYPPPPRPLEIESLRVVASGRGAARPGPAGGRGIDPAAVASPARRRCWAKGGWVEAVSRERDALEEGAELRGPALIVEAHSATWVAPSWSCHLDAAGALVLERRG